MDLLNSAYDTVSTSIDTLVKTKLLPSMQTSSAAQPWGC